MNARALLVTIVLIALAAPCATCAADAPRPNVVLILADDMGYSDLACYGSTNRTPNLDRLAAEGVRFTQFYNAARCCPTRAALLTGLYPHQAGVGDMLQDWQPPAYTTGLNDRCATFGELLHASGYRTYYVGKWHVGRLVGKPPLLGPLDRGFERFYGTGGGGNYFAPAPLMDGREPIKPPGENYYLTDDLSAAAVRFIDDHARDHKTEPFLLHLCYTAPHFPLHAKPEDIARHRGKFRDGWDAERSRRYKRQVELGLIDANWQLSPRDPVATSWADAPDKEEWDLRMAVHAAMIDCMDQGIGRVLQALEKGGLAENTLVLFLSDNGASAEALDSWPDPARGHKPGSVTGTKESHRCLEVGWANAANTPFREHKMWVHEGGISTPLIARWPTGIAARGTLIRTPGHIIDIAPTLLDLAGASYPAELTGRTLTPLKGQSLAAALRGEPVPAERTLYWEHEGNRAIRQGDWKLVAQYRGDWELYNLKDDRTECHNLAKREHEKAAKLAALWQQWADRVGVVDWTKLPGSEYKPSARYRRKSEAVEK